MVRVAAVWKLESPLLKVPTLRCPGVPTYQVGGCDARTPANWLTQMSLTSSATA
jgi:hypothetical protein